MPAYAGASGAAGQREGHRTGPGPRVRGPCPVLAGPGGLRGAEAPLGDPCQNLMLPIIPAMFVVRSLIVGAIVEEAR